MNSDTATGSRRIAARAVLRQVAQAAFAAPLLLTLGCSGSLYKVKPASELARLPDNAATADLGAISFRAAPLLTDEESQELFESNLHLAGLLPVRVEITHNSGVPIDLKKVLDGKSPDVPMEADDILVVPSSVPQKAALRALEAAVQMGTGIVIWRR